MNEVIKLTPKQFAINDGAIFKSTSNKVAVDMRPDGTVVANLELHFSIASVSDLQKTAGDLRFNSSGIFNLDEAPIFSAPTFSNLVLHVDSSKRILLNSAMGDLSVATTATKGREGAE